MRIYDEDFNIVEHPDMEAGCTVMESRSIVHRWVVDVEEESHEEVIAEYPETGGKDIAIVIDVDERGHWGTWTEDGAPIDFEGVVPDDWPHDAAIEDVEEYVRYVPYTENEAVARERDRADAAASSAVREQMRVAVGFAVMSLALDDEQAMSVSALYPGWVVGDRYSAGDIRRYSGTLYRALQGSTGAAEHTPDVATSLWKRIGDPDQSGVFPWVQPLGATDAYAKGDKVSHGGKTWVSNLDANVWQPGVYGWTEAAR